jgi:tetratricopeptide (TPR) repeat protein
MQLFLSYSGYDAPELAARLYEGLKRQAPGIEVWWDRPEVRSGAPWDRQIEKGLDACDALLFVATRDSVHPASICSRELHYVQDHGKPVITLRAHAGVEMPLLVRGDPALDFTQSFEEGFEHLLRDLAYFQSPEGKLALLERRRRYLEYRLPREEVPDRRRRIEEELQDLNARQVRQREIASDPDRAREQVALRIEAGLARERRSARVVHSIAGTRIVNLPPLDVPETFQNRGEELKRIRGLLRRQSKRLLWVIGPRGTGKTATVCQALRRPPLCSLPGDPELRPPDGILYLSTVSRGRLDVSDLYLGLCALLPDEAAARLEASFRTTRPLQEKMASLLGEFQSVRAIVFLDGFEESVEPRTGGIRDPEMREALAVLLDSSPHGVKLILTAHFPPADLMASLVARQAQIDLSRGLESPHAENLLRALAEEHGLELGPAERAVVAAAREATGGNPEGLERVFALLVQGRPESLLGEDRALPKEELEHLVGQTFAALDAEQQKVLQALAIYGRPVIAAAVDHLLAPFWLGVDSGPLLARAARLRVVRRQEDRFYLDKLLEDYALALVPAGAPADRDREDPPRFTRFSLFHRAAGYFAAARKREIESPEDLDLFLAEFDLRVLAGEHDDAALLLINEINGWLLKTGRYGQGVHLHQRLAGLLTRPDLEAPRSANLGGHLSNLGLFEQAAAAHEHALRIALRIGAGELVGIELHNLGTCRSETGDLKEAFRCFQGALHVAEHGGFPIMAVAALIGLGNCYEREGRIADALSRFEAALEISRAQGLHGDEGECLTSLGNCHARLGELDRALSYFEQAIEKITDPISRGTTLHSLSEALIDQERYPEALERAVDGREIGERVKSPKLLSETGSALALAHLLAGDSPAARAAAEEAARIQAPASRHHALLLLGLIHLLAGEEPAARKTLQEALGAADGLIRKSSGSFAAFDTRGLALCGLALLGRRGAAAQAAAAFRSARHLHAAEGTVKRVERLLALLRTRDAAGVLKGISAAGGGVAPGRGNPPAEPGSPL